jgi:tripartite-type tricarboxylate transporter receptor subunit TctC
MKKSYRTAFTAVAALAGGVALAAPASADAIEDFYKGKQLTIVVGFGAGGGVDTFARFVGTYLGKHIPGNPNVVVQNMPGGGGFKSTNYIYNAAPQDGTYITTMLSSNAIEPAMGNPGARWDTFKLHWLGNATRDFGACIASGRSGFKSIKDAMDREIVIGATGPSALTAQQPFAMIHLLGIKAKVILGYQGTREIWGTMEKGETDAACAFWASLALGPQSSQMKSGEFVPIVQFGSKPHPVFGDAPMIYDLAKDDFDRQVMRFVFGHAEISRPFAAPPGVPADRVAALRKAFWANITSDETKALAEKQNLIIDPMTAEETEAAFRDILSMPADVVKRAGEVIRRPDGAS